MKVSDLTPEQRQLINTNFGEFDKVAAEQVKFAGDLYAAGASLAEQAAASMEKAAAEAKEKEEKKEEKEDEEKTAAARDNGNIVAEGFIDKLAALGVERYNDPMAYFIPMMEEKVAEAGARAALSKFAGAKDSILKSIASKGKDAMKGATAYAGKAKKDIVAAATGKTSRGKELGAMERVKLLKRPGAIAGGAGAAGLAGLGAYHAAKND